MKQDQSDKQIEGSDEQEQVVYKVTWRSECRTCAKATWVVIKHSLSGFVVATGFYIAPYANATYTTIRQAIYNHRHEIGLFAATQGADAIMRAGANKGIPACMIGGPDYDKTRQILVDTFLGDLDRAAGLAFEKGGAQVGSGAPRSNN